MIGNITRGSNFGGLGRYLYATGKHHEAHVNPRAVAAGNVMRDDSREWRPWVADMQWCAQQRPDVSKPVWHCSIRASPEDRIMSDQEWGQIASEHIDRMGLQDHPWVAVRHGDDHIHIVASRVNGNGEVWHGKQDRPRNMSSMRQIEKRHNLIRLTGDRDTSRLATVTRSEREKGKRLGIDPERAQLRDALHEAVAAAQGRGPAGLEAELASRGVLFRANTTKDGLKVQGYSVSKPGWRDADNKEVWLKASEVDRKLSWSKVSAQLGGDRTTHATAVEAARATALGHRPTTSQAGRKPTRTQDPRKMAPHPAWDRLPQQRPDQGRSQ
jgi:hypothetical protein